MRKYLFIALMTPLISVGQITATTESGKKVILNNNGTWKYIPLAKSVGTSNEAISAPRENDKGIDLSGSGKPKDCAQLITTETDKVSGKTTTGSKVPLTVSGTGKVSFSYLFVKSRSLIIGFTINNVPGCIDDKAEITILFRDGSRSKINSHSDFNCKGTGVIYLGGVFGNTDLLDQLKTKEIEVMRVATRSSYEDAQFTVSQSQDFKIYVNCLSDLAGE